MNKELTVQRVTEDLSAGARVSSLRRDLKEEGFSSDEAQEILAAALRARSAQRHERRPSGRRWALPVLGLAVGVLVVTYLAAPPGGLYLVPVGLFGYGFYLWHGSPNPRM